MKSHFPSSTQSYNQVSLSHLLFSEFCTRPRTGYGYASAHQGEILQGIFSGVDNCWHRGLVTLPCKLFKTEAIYVPNSKQTITLTPSLKLKARKAAELTLADCGVVGLGGHLTLHSNISEGLGLGSSTSDVVATIQAVADAFGKSLIPKDIAKIAVKAEITSDSIMFDNRAILFAQREGIIIEDFCYPLPALECLGFNTATSGISVDTVTFKPAEYDWREIETFEVLRGLIKYAVCNQNPRLIGQVASASARINQRYLPTPAFKRLEQIVKTVEALGLAVAHSGTVASLLFDPQDATTRSRILQSQKFLSKIGLSHTWQFQTAM
jgi:uncharacterized protein involved in propanediol utilization